MPARPVTAPAQAAHRGPAADPELARPALTTQAHRRSSSDPLRLVDAIWDFLTSIRLAILLLLLISAGALVGAGVPQAPPPALESPEQFALWLGQQRPRFGNWTDTLAAVSAFNVFGSLWFRVLLLLLAANVLVCTLSRMERIWKAARRPLATHMSDAMFERAPLRGEVEIDAPLGVACGRLGTILAGRRYVIARGEQGGVVQLVATKNRYGPLGTLANHLGIITVLVGVVAGGAGGFIESQFVIAEGDTRPVGHETNLDIQLVSFMDEYYTGGGGIPKDYRSDVVVTQAGREVARGTVRVNEPLIVQGVRIHQSFYGPAILMQVRDHAGKVLHEGPVPLRFSVADRPAGSFALPAFGMEAFVIGSSSSFIDDVVSPGQVRLEVYAIGGTQPVGMKNVSQGKPETIGPLEFTFVRESRFTGLQVVKDPALPLVWLGCAMVVVGSAAVLYFPRRTVWVRLIGDGVRTRVSFASARERGLPYEHEFGRLVEAAGASLPPARANPDGSS